MEEWQKRVIAERNEVSERFIKLAEFLAKGAPGATAGHCCLLRLQRKAMIDYLDILNDRISLFDS